MDFRQLAWSLPVARVRHMAEGARRFMLWAGLARLVLFVRV